MTVEIKTAAPERAQGPTRPARPAKPNRKTVLAGIAVYAIARLPMDRRFQQSVILLAIGLAAAKRIMQESTLREFKVVSAFTERNYLREKGAQLHAAEQKTAGEVRAAAAHRPHRQ